MPSCEHCGAPQDFLDEPCAYCGPLPKVIKRAPKPHLPTNYIKMGRNIIVASVTICVTWCFYHVPARKPQQDKPLVAAQTAESKKIRTLESELKQINDRNILERMVQQRLEIAEAERKEAENEAFWKEEARKQEEKDRREEEEWRRKNDEQSAPKKEIEVNNPPKQVESVMPQTKPAESQPNPNRLLVMGKIETLQKLINKQKRIVDMIKTNSTPCSECGGTIDFNCIMTYPNSMKTETVWKCWHCGKTYPNRKNGEHNEPIGQFIYKRNRESPSEKARQEAAYRQQSLVLEDLQKQLGILEKTLNGVPLLASDVPPPPPTPPAEPKPRRFYVLQDKEVEVVSEVETGQEVVVKTPKGEFIVLKRKDIKDIVTR